MVVDDMIVVHDMLLYRGLRAGVMVVVIVMIVNDMLVYMFMWVM